ncbi:MULTISPECIES: glycosyltransferase family 39 protein [Thermomonosporaceae]|uniref:glycosyltransferase family 39 protein n=1 Tax=Thermomonosporaceae TaxID=2012 RepID=UPI00255B26CD|nr:MULTISPECIES: glycosyltransferase family 39 protein [Thermomonosporaceae]MDL4776928.1 glycosyltransferase family 39 protein [Actinomadura xylanilytica]
MTPAQTMPAPPAAPQEHPTATRRLRALLLGRPDDPRWSRPALWAVLLLALALYAWNLPGGGHANTYYSAAVKSGTQSWKAFFFGSLDAGSFITVDKPPMALWAMGLFARVLGFGAWSLLLPQALFGVASIAVLHATVRRAFGHPAALIAAAVLALTPITVAINRDNNPDTLLVLLLVLAAWACLRAIEDGRARWLPVSAAFVGCGFNTKMLQAYLVVPAFALVYLIAARPGPVRRVLHLLAAGVVLAVSSLWWMAVVDLTPASKRPFIGGSTDGTVRDLVIGYNGLGRIFGQSGPTAGRGPGGGAGFGGASGAGRLVNDTLGGQISWLLPFAGLALAAGLILLWKRPRTDLARAALLLWGGWLAVHVVVFSFAAGTFHPYYSTAMGPAIAALTGAGAVLLYGAYRRSRAWAWAPPVAIAVTAAWAFALLDRTPDWNPWLRWALLAAAALAIANLAAGRLIRRAGRPVMVAGPALALAAGLAGPSAYAVSAASTATTGTNPLAGPASGMGFGGPGGPGGAPGGRRDGDDGRPEGTRGRPSGAQNGPGGGMPPGMPAGGTTPEGMPPGGAGGPGGAGAPGGGGGTRGGGGPGGAVDAKMTAYLEQRQGTADWLVAVDNSQQASSLILQTGRPVIAMGGFTGIDPAMTVAKLQRYVQQGRLHYVLVGTGRGGGFGGPDAGNSAVTAWVERNGTAIAASTYGGRSTTSGSQLYYLR